MMSFQSCYSFLVFDCQYAKSNSRPKILIDSRNIMKVNQSQRRAIRSYEKTELNRNFTVWVVFKAIRFNTIYKIGLIILLIRIR